MRELVCKNCGGKVYVMPTDDYGRCSKCSYPVFNENKVVSTFRPIEELIKNKINKNCTYRSRRR